MNRFHLPRTPRNVNLPFLDSSIPREMRFSEELPSLVLIPVMGNGDQLQFDDILLTIYFLKFYNLMPFIAQLLIGKFFSSFSLKVWKNFVN